MKDNDINYSKQDMNKWQRCNQLILLFHEIKIVKCMNYDVFEKIIFCLDCLSILNMFNEL